MLLAGDDDVPFNYNDIRNKPDADKWYKAVRYKLQALKRNKTWKLVDRPKGVNIVGCKFFFF